MHDPTGHLLAAHGLIVIAVSAGDPDRFRARRRVAVFVVALIACIGSIAVVGGVPGRHTSDATRRRVERDLSRARCPGQPPLPTRCEARGGGFDCRVAGRRMRVDDPEHFEISIIC
jgi:hypothetical protein